VLCHGRSLREAGRTVSVEPCSRPGQSELRAARCPRQYEDRDTGAPRVVDIDKRHADRLRVMRAIFDDSNGSQSEVVRILPSMENRLGLTQQDVVDACYFLAGEGLIAPNIKAGGLIIAVEITHKGIREMEDSIRSPTQPTKHFPPAYSIVNVHGSGNVIQSGSPGASQHVSIGTLNQRAVRAFLKEYDAQAHSLDLSASEADELTAEIDTVKAQLRSPKPKRHIIKESLISARSILEITAGSTAGASLLELLSHVHL
jgi:hypothetical protein